MPLLDVPQFLHKLYSNLWKNWITGGLFVGNPTRLIHFNGKFAV